MQTIQVTVVDANDSAGDGGGGGETATAASVVGSGCD